MKRRPEYHEIHFPGFRPPSLFDTAVLIFMIGLIAIYNNPHTFMNKMAASLWLVYGSIGLWALGLMIKPVRSFRSLPLALLVLWTGACVFLHSWRNDPGNAAWYINWCMLNEGFIYVFAGALLISTIVRYAQEWRWYYFMVGVVMAGWFYQFVLPTKSNSPLLALIVALPIVMYKKGEKCVKFPAYTMDIHFHLPI
jgi:hypothetical protein